MPIGGITYKTINGKKYPYLQWTENGKQRGRRVKAEELEILQAGIDECKRLQALLKDTREQSHETKDELRLSTFYRIGDDFKAYIQPVLRFRKRDCFTQLHDCLHNNSTDKVYFHISIRLFSLLKSDKSNTIIILKSCGEYIIMLLKSLLEVIYCAKTKDRRPDRTTSEIGL